MKMSLNLIQKGEKRLNVQATLETVTLPAVPFPGTPSLQIRSPPMSDLFSSRLLFFYPTDRQFLVPRRDIYFFV